MKRKEKMLNWEEKKEAMGQAAKYVMKELHIDLTEAVIKMRETALRKGNDELAEDLKNYGIELILGENHGNL
jgi:hypothetical protein